MPRAKFEVDYTSLVSRNGEPLAAGTINIYKAALNKIAADGYTNKEALLENQSTIVKTLQSRVSDKTKQRITLSAIFRVLQDIPNEKKAGFYEAFKNATEADFNLKKTSS